MSPQMMQLHLTYIMHLFKFGAISFSSTIRVIYASFLFLYHPPFFLPQLRPFLDFPFPFHITCIPAVPLSRATPVSQSLSFTPGYCSYSRLFTYSWRFRVRNHRLKRNAVLVFLSLGYLTQYTTILGYIASSKSAWITWDLVSKEEKKGFEREFGNQYYLWWYGKVMLKY